MNRDIQSQSPLSLNMRKIKEQKAELEEAFNDCSIKIHGIYLFSFFTNIQILNKKSKYLIATLIKLLSVSFIFSNIQLKEKVILFLKIF